MPGIILPHRWTKQPSGPVALRSEAAFGADLVVDGRGPAIEILRQAAVTVGASVSFGVSAPGRLLNFAGGDTNSYISVPISSALGTGEWTLVLLSPNFETYVASGNARYGYAGDIGNANAFIADHPDPTPDSMGWYEGGARGCGPSIVSKQQYRMMAWRRVGNAVSAWLDGKTTGTTYTTSANLTATTLNLGGFKALSMAVLHPVCSFDFALLYRRALNDAELQEIDRAPYGYTFKPSGRRRIYVPSAGTGGDITQALTGSAVTASAGTLGASHEQALSGTAATASAGTLGASHEQALSGTAATASAGTLSPQHSQALAGQAAAASAGTLAPSHSQALTGQAITASAGTVTYTADGAVTLALTGQAVTAIAGTLAPEHSQALTGQAVTASAGTVTYTGGSVLTIALTGQAVTATAGSLSPAVALLLAGSSIVVSAGTITATGGDLVAIDAPDAHTILGAARVRSHAGRARVRSVTGLN